ncbi:TPA: AAA family ATPase [Bacillus cereus]|nr:hypothetical protein CN415_24620 [Bacillus cereus]
MINSIHIKNLNGYRNINIDFHRDLTFLVGINGSGKTTVLNIMSCILLGEFEKLQEYIFDEVTILYRTKEENLSQIKVKKRDIDAIEFTWKNETVILDIDEIRLRKLRNMRMHGLTKNSKYDEKLVQQYHKEISQEVNLGFLPLSREINMRKFYDLAEELYLYRQEIENEKNAKNYGGNLEESLIQVEEMIKEQYRKIMLKFEKKNKEIQKKMFECMLEYDETALSLGDLPTEEMIEELKNVLEELGISIPGLKTITTRFLKDMTSLMDTKENQLDEDEKSKLNQRILINMYQITKIRKLCEIVNKFNSFKNIELKTVNMFFQIINEFFKDSNKELIYSNEKGELTFSTQIRGKIYKGYSLGKLSSGEKQLVIFFAYLLFKVGQDSRSTYIIDEPELSLHPAWQRKFTKALLGLNKNVQFIFATHSPEIIGGYRNKAIIMGRDL